MSSSRQSTINNSFSPVIGVITMHHVFYFCFFIIIFLVACCLYLIEKYNSLERKFLREIEEISRFNAALKQDLHLLKEQLELITGKSSESGMVLPVQKTATFIEYLNSPVVANIVTFVGYGIALGVAVWGGYTLYVYVATGVQANGVFQLADVLQKGAGNCASYLSGLMDIKGVPAGAASNSASAGTVPSNVPLDSVPLDSVPGSTFSSELDTVYKYTDLSTNCDFLYVPVAKDGLATGLYVAAPDWGWKRFSVFLEDYTNSAVSQALAQAAQQTASNVGNLQSTPTMPGVDPVSGLDLFPQLSANIGAGVGGVV